MRWIVLTLSLTLMACDDSMAPVPPELVLEISPTVVVEDGFLVHCRYAVTASLVGVDSARWQYGKSVNRTDDFLARDARYWTPADLSGFWGSETLTRHATSKEISQQMRSDAPRGGWRAEEHWSAIAGTDTLEAQASRACSA